MNTMANLMFGRHAAARCGEGSHRVNQHPGASLGCTALVVATLILVSTATASAQVLSIQSSDREVAAFGTSFCEGCGDNGEDVIVSNGNSIPSTQLGVFDESVFSLGSDASQLSNVSAHSISGTGSNALGGSGDNDGLSTMLVDFTVLQTGLFQLSGGISVSTPSSSDNAAHVILSSAGGDLLNEVVFDNGTVNFDESFLLQAGTVYTLDASVVGSDFGLGSGGSWSVNLIPEPSTALLLGSFVVVLGTRRRKATRSK